MTKKAAALLLAASLAVSVCAMPVFATGAGTTPEMGSHEGSDTTTSANTVVTYKVDCSYTWSIPKKIDFGANAGVGKTRIVEAIADKNAENKAATDNGAAGKGNVPKVCVTSNIIDDDKTLRISIDTTNGTTYDEAQSKFYVETTSNTAQKLYFTIAKPADGAGSSMKLNATNSEVMSVPSGTNQKDQALEFKLTTTTTDTAEKAGTYNGKVVFKSELKPTT